MKNFLLPLILFTGCMPTSCSKKKQEPVNQVETITETFEQEPPQTLDSPDDEDAVPKLPILVSKQIAKFKMGVASEQALQFKFFDSQKHSVSATELPSWLSFDVSSNTLSGTPSGEGSQQVILKISGTESAKADTVKLEIKNDPLLVDSWHYKNTAQNSFSQSSGTAEIDLNLSWTTQQGITGTGVKIAISDTGAESSHPDLVENHLSQLSRDYTNTAPYSGTPDTSSDAHGTAVAGIIAALGWNDIGIRGIAPGANFSTLNFLDSDQTDTMLLDQITGPFDIFNQSWGLNLTRVSPLELDYRELLKSNVQTLRQGKGAIYVRAVGNNFSVCEKFLCSENSSTDPYNTSPYTINVAGVNAEGKHASYSTAGSAVWIAAPSGEFGKEEPAIVTTDITGCDKGYAKSDASKNDFEKGEDGNNNCDYTSTFNGTSAAAPMVSGAVALLLEVNPSLTWRDVKYLLASTASIIDGSFAAVTVPDLNLNFTDPWVTNDAGFQFHSFYGFGMINIDAAVIAAKSYTNHLPALTETTNWSTGNWKYQSGTLNQSVPDKSDTGTSHSINVTESTPIEAIMVEINLTHAYPNEVMITLTSPNGTTSTILNTFNSFVSDPNISGWNSLSNAFYREIPTGTWTIRVYDTLQDDTGTLDSWKLNIISDVN